MCNDVRAQECRAVMGAPRAELKLQLGYWKSQEFAELAVLEWVSWFNEHRLMEWLGHIPPAEAEADCYRRLEELAAKAA